MPHSIKKAHLALILCLIFLLSGCSSGEVEDKLGWLDNKVGEQLGKMEKTDLSSSATSTEKKKEEASEKEKKQEKEVKSAKDLTEEQKEKIDEWLQKNGYNRYGDSQDAIYTGGTPLFNERTGEKMNRYDYILKKFPNILKRAEETGDNKD